MGESSGVGGNFNNLCDGLLHNVTSKISKFKGLWLKRKKAFFMLYSFNSIENV